MRVGSFDLVCGIRLRNFQDGKMGMHERAGVAVIIMVVNVKQRSKRQCKKHGTDAQTCTPATHGCTFWLGRCRQVKQKAEPCRGSVKLTPLKGGNRAVSPN